MSDMDGSSDSDSDSVLIILCSSAMILVFGAIYYYYMYYKKGKGFNFGIGTTTSKVDTTTSGPSSTTAATSTNTTTPRVVGKIGDECRSSKECPRVCCGKAGSVGTCMDSCQGLLSRCQFKFGNNQCASIVAQKTTKKPSNATTCNQGRDCATGVCCGQQGKAGYCMDSCEGTGFCQFGFTTNNKCQ